jgi:uncharacterized protein YcbX
MTTSGPPIMSDAVATIAQLYLYPVKSMAGIPVQEAHVGLDGILGDRQYSFVRAERIAKGHQSQAWHLRQRRSPRRDSRARFHPAGCAA